MARWASFIDSIRALQPTLLVDTGNFCRPDRFEGSDLDYIYLFEAMKKMEYDAVNIADNEIRYGRERILDVIDDYGFPAVSANIFDKRSGKLLAEPWIVRDIGGRRTLFGRRNFMRIGIFGLTLPSFIHRIDPLIPKYYEIENPKLAGLEAVSSLEQKGCDIIIAVSHQGWNNSLELARDVPGIDIVINGRKSHEGTHYEWVDSTLVVDTGNHRTSFTEIEVVFRGGRPVIKARDVGTHAHDRRERPDLKELEDRYQAEKKAREIGDLKGTGR